MSRRIVAAVTWLVSSASLLLAPVTDASAAPQVPRATSTSQTSTKAKAKAGTKTRAKRSTAKRATTTKRTAATVARKPATKTPPPFASLWPVKGPELLPGSILPHKRIVAYYGNPLSRRMGVLGEYEVNEMLRRLDREVAAWERADTLTPVVPALHLIATVAQGAPGRDGKWRTRMSDSLIERVYRWAERRNALLFLDVQVAHSSLKAELPPLAKFLARPNVHLGIDPEFAMKGDHPPGTRIGSYDARDVNYAMDFLADLVDEHKLPPKVLVIHRFTRPMLTNSSKIELDPRVQVVIHMDGWGSASLKKGSYDSYVASEPVQFTGFKLFYKNDVRKKGWRLMRPAEVLALTPKPVYIQYQ
jgi:hypothetical protein